MKGNKFARERVLKFDRLNFNSFKMLSTNQNTSIAHRCATRTTVVLPAPRSMRVSSACCTEASDSVS